MAVQGHARSLISVPMQFPINDEKQLEVVGLIDWHAAIHYLIRTIGLAVQLEDMPPPTVRH